MSLTLVGTERLHLREVGAKARSFAPGIVAGLSDNDPTTIATLAVVGATTVFGLTWLVVVVFPMLVTVQVMSARLGTAEKRGLQAAVREHHKRAGFVLLLAILGVNAITLVADLEAGAAAMNLLAPAGWRWFVVPCAAVVVAMLVFGNYGLMNRVLRRVVLVFLVYVAAAFLAHPHWGSVVAATVRPHFSLNSNYVAGALALLGTSLTGYVYVWETIEEAEEDRPRSERRVAEWDAAIGMAATAALFWFILVTTGATLGEHHKTVQTAQDAASALGPAAGSFAKYLFAVGLLAASLLAIPVLAASSAYVVGDQFGWRTGLTRRVSEAKPFYATLIGLLAIGAAVALAGISPIQLLFAASIAGGIGTPIGIFFLLFSLRGRSAPRDARAGWKLTAAAVATLAIVCLANLAFFGNLLWGRV